MNFIDILSLSLSFLGINGIVLSLRYLIPCYIIPFLSVHLHKTQQLLTKAEAIIAIPHVSEYKTRLDLYVYLYFNILFMSYFTMPFYNSIITHPHLQPSTPIIIPPF